MKMTDTEQKLLVFTDMDGSLLDHHDYSFEPAIPLLEKLEVLDIPVIPATSKTKAEVLHLRKDLNNSHPFIVENGAAVFIPTGYFPEQPFDTEELGEFWVKKFTHSRQYWLSLITHTSLGFDKFQTFSESTATDIMEMTGLAQEDAVRASRRHFGEPVSWRGDDIERDKFISELQQLGATVVHGGRFIHVSGECDKSIALTWLTEQYQEFSRQPYLTLAVGDSNNDINMLEVADYSVEIPSPARPRLDINKAINLYRVSLEGPNGWVEGVSEVLEKLNLSKEIE